MHDRQHPTAKTRTRLPKILSNETATATYLDLSSNAGNANKTSEQSQAYTTAVLSSSFETNSTLSGMQRFADTSSANSRKRLRSNEAKALHLSRGKEQQHQEPCFSDRLLHRSLKSKHHEPVHCESNHEMIPSNTVDDVKFNTYIYTYIRTTKRLTRRQDINLSESKASKKLPARRQISYSQNVFGGVPGARLRNKQVQTRSNTPSAKAFWMDATKQTKDMTMIGPNFQCSIPPLELSIPGHPAQFLGGDCIWDPVMAEEAKTRGEPIDEFMNTGGSLDLQTLKMQALHMSGYCIQEARRHLSSLIEAANGVDDTLTIEEEALFLQLLLQGEGAANSIKCFSKIARIMGHPLQTILIHYYRWKVADPESYSILKAKCLGDPDECVICHDGGDLLLCDSCNKAYHWKTCLPIPLDEPPAQDKLWYCDNCINHKQTKCKQLGYKGNSPLWVKK
jgi:hypothetical protein